MMALLIVVVMVSVGCNNRAHSEVYRQRMASEIRVLEDQLYDADYQNRVLQDRLQKYNNQVKSSRIPTPDEIGASPHSHHYEPVPSSALIDPNPIAIDAGVPVPTPDPNADRLEMDAPEFDATEFDGQRNSEPDPLSDGLETELPKPEPKPFDPDDFDPSMFDSGEAVAPEDLDVPKPDARTDVPEKAPDLPTEIPSRRPELFERLPAPKTVPPIGISPPGEKDTMIDPIIPGDIGPPAAGSEDEKPPGQILLPDSTQTPAGVPEDLRIHQALSIGHRDGQKLDGATLVVNAMDRMGRPIDLNDFEVDAELSIVVLDPDREPGSDRVGRWDFSRKEVAAMIAADKAGGFEIPIRFEDLAPLTDKVIVHVRLRGDDQEMRAEAKLDLRERTAASTWTPRGQ